jgi:hypothetical protein
MGLMSARTVFASAVAFVMCASLVFACEEKKEAAPAPPATTSVPPAKPDDVPSTTQAASASAPAPATPPESIAAQHVLVAWKGAKNAPASVTRSKAEAKKRAEDVAAKAKGGADFTALVAEYTDDEATKSRQGNLGKFTKAKMTPAFADAAFALKVDEVSAPVETAFGYHVIKRNQ